MHASSSADFKAFLGGLIRVCRGLGFSVCKGSLYDLYKVSIRLRYSAELKALRAPVFCVLCRGFVEGFDSRIAGLGLSAERSGFRA